MITFYEEVLDKDFALDLYKESMFTMRSGKPAWKTNSHWDEDVVQDSGIVLIKDYETAIAVKIISQLFNKGIIDHKVWKAMNYVWMPKSYIPWHNDKDQDAITIYLNPEWNGNWGGVFLYSDEPNVHVKGFVPHFNSAVKNTSALFHSTSLLTESAMPRVTIQLFSKKKEET